MSIHFSILLQEETAFKPQQPCSSGKFAVNLYISNQFVAVEVACLGHDISLHSLQERVSKMTI